MLPVEWFIFVRRWQRPTFYFLISHPPVYHVHCRESELMVTLFTISLQVVDCRCAFICWASLFPLSCIRTTLYPHSKLYRFFLFCKEEKNEPNTYYINQSTRTIMIYVIFTSESRHNWLRARWHILHNEQLIILFVECTFLHLYVIVLFMSIFTAVIHRK